MTLEQVEERLSSLNRDRYSVLSLVKHTSEKNRYMFVDAEQGKISEYMTLACAFSYIEGYDMGSRNRHIRSFGESAIRRLDE